MYLFYLCWSTPEYKATDKFTTDPDGRIISESRSKKAMKNLTHYANDLKPCGRRMEGSWFGGTLCNMETGEVYMDGSRYEIPRWFHDPLLRSIKLEQWKKENEK